VQGILELWGLPYYGSGVLASALALNKVRSKSVYRELGLLQARSLDFKRLGPDVWQRGLSPLFGDAPETLSTEALTALVAGTIGFDVMVKGASQGSTLGLAMVKEREAFWPAVAGVLAVDPEILVEERVSGIEVTAGVIGGYELKALPLIEIRPKASDLFDYEAKYTPGASEEICPARLNETLTSHIQRLALRAHRGLGCWGVSRSDFIITGDEAYILETNTLPGLTENSLIPMAAREGGLMLPDLLDRFIEWGLLRTQRTLAATQKAP
jgi:D-alanine-D-alanine ligase